MKGLISGMMLTLLLIGIVVLASDIRHVKAETEQLSKTEPFIELVDFYNGTRLMIIDYNNGTVDTIIETFTKKTSTLVLDDDIGNQSLSATFPTSLEESTQYINSTQTLVGQQALLPSIEIDIFDVIKRINPDLSAPLDIVSLVFKPFLVLEPVFGSQKITAIASALGDARIEKGSELIWHIPGQRLNFTVSANDYNGNNITDNAKIKLSDFRYYFTEFSVNCKLRFDFTQIINALGIDDVEVRIFTIDMSWLINGLYLGAHAGYQDYVHVTIIVFRSIGEPEKIDPRDIAVISGTIIPSKALFGQIVNITVVVRNLGSITENFSVTIRADNITIGTQFINQLSPDSEIELTFLWNTTDIPKHYKYTIYAEASSVPNEIDTNDNKLAIGIMVFRMLGDVNFDGIVDMLDIAIQAMAYGSYPGHPRWNSMADEDKDGIVDMLDIALTARNFGKTYK